MIVSHYLPVPLSVVDKHLGCGNVPDFDTPEYSTYGSIQTRKWETSEGMDPNSYGLNKATPPSKYKNGTTIIRTLVDVASKNGN